MPRFRCPADVEGGVLALRCCYGSTAEPFAWRFTREDLNAFLLKAETGEPAVRPAARKNALLSF